MEWGVFWQTLLGTIAGAGAVSWLAKTLVSHSLKRDLERMRNDLKMTALEREVRFRNLFERQADIFAEAYALLNEIFYNVGMFTAYRPGGTSSDRSFRFDKAQKSVVQFRAFFYPKRIYFPEATSRIIVDFYRRLRATAFDFNQALDDYEKAPSDKKDLHRIETMEKVVLDEEPAVLGIIRADFQRLIGFDVENAPDST